MILITLYYGIKIIKYPLIIINLRLNEIAAVTVIT